MEDNESNIFDSDPGFRGSTPGTTYNLRRDFSGAHGMIVRHYFSCAKSLYNEEAFERRFGSLRVVVNRFIQALIANIPFIFK